MGIISTERLLLEEVEKSDAAFIFELLNSPSWIANIGDRQINSLMDAEKYIEQSFVKTYQENGFGLYKMVLKEIGQPIGICGLVNRPTLPNVDIGFALLPNFERKGYAFEAAKATMDFAKTNLKLTTVLGITIPSNIPSRKLLEKIGLQHIKTETTNGEELMIYSTAHNFSK